MRKIEELDGLRGVAVLLVLLFHTFRIAGQRELNAFLWTSWAGVDLFFVLSGFLITSVLCELRPAENRSRVFYWRRTLRIFPLYFTALPLIYFVFPLLLQDGARPDAPFASFVTYTFNFRVFANEAWPEVIYLNHFWSLCVEEQFYLVWPAVVFFVPPARLALACAAVFGLALATKLLLFAGGTDAAAIYTFPLARMDALAAGAWVAARSRGPDPPVPRGASGPLLGAGGVALAAWILAAGGLRLHSAQVAVFATSAFAVFFAGVIAHVTPRAGGPGLGSRLLRSPPLRFFGRYSYGIYVYHVPVLFLLRDHTDLRDFGPPIALLTTLCTLAVAMLSFHTLESFFLRRKQRIPARMPHTA